MVLNAIRSRPGGRAAAATNPPAGAGIDVVTSKNNAASATVREIGPLTLSPFHASSCGASGTRSRCGLMPYTPHHVDGIRIDPAPSDPSANPASPAATATADPPLLPPGVRPTSHGFRVAPNVSDSVNGQMHSSGTCVLPTITAPASRSLRTTSASCSFAGPCALVPIVVTSPATSTSSLIATGTPSSGNRSPASSRRCAVAASARADSSSTTR